MERKWFNLMLFNRDLEYRCGLSNSIDSFDPIENNGVNEDPSILTDDPSILTDMDNDIHSWKNNSENDSYRHGDYLVDLHFDDSDNYNANISDLNSYISDDTNDSDLYQIENYNDTNDSDLYQIENSNGTNDSDLYQIENSNDTNDSDFTPIENSNDTNDSNFTPIENSNDTNDSDFTPIEYSNDTNNSKFTPIQYPDDPKDTSYTQQFKHLWVQCESCFGLNYKKFLNPK
ncbi:unnamed protein product [Vicia faba]|uniref:Uncharacterized protein n=1 Tax=Vicia faba TaxID=3906 RepID=A0AAV0ZWB1_VICFA|nr:unnamed protein product [Vicia faba]